jgi:hypothetical protein
MEIISLGYKCNMAKYLRDNNLRNFSYPFDWVITMSLSTINNILNDKYIINNYLSNIIIFCN